MKPHKRDILAGTYGDITATRYQQLLSIIFDLPPTLAQGRKYTNRQRNAIRRANLIRKKIEKRYDKSKSLHQRPDNGD
jgi:hypothetical protein